MRSQIFPNMADLLDALVQSTGESRDINTVVSRVVTTLQAWLEAYACVIYPMNPITRNFIKPSITSSGPQKQDVISVLRDEHLAKEILKYGFLMIDDLEHTEQVVCKPEILATFQRIPDACALVTLPLRIRGRQIPLGIVYVMYRECLSFNESDDECFQIVTDQISSILERVWREQRYRELASIGQDLNHELSDSVTLFEMLKNHISSIVDANYALLLAVYQPQGGTLDIYQAVEGRLIIDAGHAFEGACKYVIENRKALFIRQKSREHLVFDIGSIEEGTGPQESFIYVPLMLRGEPIGVLSIQHPEADAYTEEDQFILELLANYVALALHNTRLYKNLSLLQETGQILTQQFESVNTPQAIVDSIKEATKADVVILYRYNATERRFVLPAVHAGILLDPVFSPASYPPYPGSVSLLMLEQGEAIFAKESETLYSRLIKDDSIIRQGRFSQREQISSAAAIPLRVGENIVGVLFLNFRQPQRFDATQQVLFEGLAHYAAIAIKNAQTFEHLSERRIHELETLRNIDSKLNATNPDLDGVLNTILRLAEEQVPAEHASILLLNEQRQVFTFAATSGPRKHIRMQHQFVELEQTGIIRWVMDHKEAALVNNVQRDLPWRAIYLKTISDTISELDVPLLDEGKAIGIFNFESPYENAFKQEDVQFLDTLAGQAVLAIKKAQAYEREKHFAERFRLLYEAGQELGKITEVAQLETAYQTIVRLAQELSQSPVVIRRYNEEKGVLEVAHASGFRHSPPSRVIELDEGYNGKVAREHRTIVIEDVDTCPADEYPLRPADPTMHSLLITPIKFKHRYYGNLELTHEVVAHFHDKDPEFFEGLAQQLASTLYRLEIMQERQELKQRNQAAEAMIYIGQSTYEITHRLGNDLGLVSSHVNAIQKILRELNVHHEAITSKLNYIDQAVNKVMDLSESLRTELGNWNDNDRFIQLPPRVILEDAQDSITIPSEIDVRLEVVEEVPFVLVIHNLIIDALRNLITNAMQAMPGGGELTLRARNAGRYVALEVIDTGTGIPHEQQEKIFDLFFSTKHSSGFGLWSARRHVLKNRGELEVSSEPGQGTTFTVLLPRDEEKNV
jgi:GAF domain-containing protein/anti-sigma regulatory factor (Ser/Thr protein kinase)